MKPRKLFNALMLATGLAAAGDARAENRASPGITLTSPAARDTVTSLMRHLEFIGGYGYGMRDLNEAGTGRLVLVAATKKDKDGYSAEITDQLSTTSSSCTVTSRTLVIRNEKDEVVVTRTYAAGDPYLNPAMAYAGIKTKAYAAELLGKGAPAASGLRR